MSEIRLHVTFTTKDPAKFLEAAKQVVEATNKESGCILYSLFRELDDESGLRFAMIEAWESAEALTAHSKSDHVAKFRKDVEPYIESESDVVIKRYTRAV